MTWEVREGDCVSLMAAMPAGSVDAVVCDPPYGLEFMGKDWDRIGARSLNPSMQANKSIEAGDPEAGNPWASERSSYGTPKRNPRCRKCGKQKMNHPKSRCSCEQPDWDLEGWHYNYKMQEWHERWATEALRVLKPGGHLLAAGGSRTYHRLTCAIEDAGFEVRDCITHLYGSGFPKSLNVSEALRGLPACTCDVAGELGSVDPSGPAGTVGAGVGTEPGAVPLAGFSADGTGGIGAETSAGTSRSVADVERGVEQVDGEASPVVLGSSAVAGVAAGDEVGPNVRGVEVDPEALGDQVVGDGGNALAVEADGTGQDVGADLGPADPFVLPLATAPGGIAGASEPATVGDGHAGSGAVDPGRDVALESSVAHGAGEGGGHPTKCKACGGVRGEIPDGFGTALKPAAEFWVVARKPLSGTVAGNVLEHGTGALHVDGCRVEGEVPQVTQGLSSDPTSWEPRSKRSLSKPRSKRSLSKPRSKRSLSNPHSAGRWPANVVLSHTEGCVQVGTRKVKGQNPVMRNDQQAAGGYGGMPKRKAGTEPDIADADGMETVGAWSCTPECAVRLLDEQTGELTSGRGQVTRGFDGSPVYGDGDREFESTDRGFGDSGGASRFFYVAKASRGERNAGLEGFEEGEARKWNERNEGSGGTRDYYPDGTPRPKHTAQNVHPTVKPISLMRWLVRLVTPPGGTCLDPFAGSGTTGIAAILEGFDFIGLEREQEYVAIAEARIAWWHKHRGDGEAAEILAAGELRDEVEATGQLGMFDE